VYEELDLSQIARLRTEGLSESPELANFRRYTVSRLTLTNFRCYENLRLDLGPEPVVLTGPNGAGKTNILEALSLLIPGRGLRRPKLSEISKTGGDGSWAAAVEVNAPDGPVRLGTGFTPNDRAAREKRIVRIDGESASNQNVLSEFMSLYWITPQMDGLFIDGPSARRQFFDRLIYAWDPAHAGRISAYETAMRERSRLLRDDPRPDPAWLTALESTMAERGIAVAAARLELLHRLGPASSRGLAPFPGADLALSGDLENWLSTSPALEAEDRFRSILADGRRRDGETGRTGCGPHRSDLIVHHAGTGQAADLCSTGEQKALLIAIVLANAKLRSAEKGAVPLLLLDEVAAHLDGQRREALFDHLITLGAQTWFTGTDETLYQPLGNAAQMFRVEDGHISGM
jgi:DNA replication and repair protein RecF